MAAKNKKFKMISKHYRGICRCKRVFFILASSPSAPSIIDFKMMKNQLSNTGFVRYNK
jgi:hypothetical protein